MTGMPDPSFTPTFKYPSQQSTQVGKCTPSLPVECFNGSNHRSEHAGLHEPVHPDQQHCADLPGCGSARSRCGPHPVHPRNRRTCVLDIRGNREHDRRTHAQRLPIEEEEHYGEHGCSNNRSQNAGHSEPVDIDREHCPGVSRRRESCNRGRPNPVHPCNCGTGILALWKHSFHDRKSHALGVQVRSPNKPAGGLQARIFLLALLISIAIVPLVSATTYISFSPVGMDPDDLHIYNNSGTLIGIYNTSSTAIPLSNNQSYSILVVPANQNMLGNHPQAWFELFVTKLRENAVGLVIAMFFVAVLLAGIARR